MLTSFITSKAMIMSNKIESTEEKNHELINNIVSIAAGAIGAFIGGPAGAAIGVAIPGIHDRIKESPIERRIRDWEAQLNESIDCHLSHVLQSENLTNNPVFVSTIIHATNIALRNHEQEKLSALKNAVINSAFNLGDSANYQIYLNLINDLSPAHLYALKFFYNPAAWFRQRNIAESRSANEDPTELLVLALPDLKELASYLVNDLMMKGLIASLDSEGVFKSKLDGTPKPTYMAKQTTTIADQFLLFISENKS